MAQTGPTKDELDAAKTGIYSDIVTSLEEIGGFSGVADRMNKYNQFHGDPGWLNKDLERYAAVTADGVKNAVAAQLAKTKRVVVYGIPGEKKIPPAPPTPPAVEKVAQKIEPKEPWRATVPKPAAASTAALPKAQTVKLANGLTVYLVESHELPVVAGELVVRSGSAADPAGKHGLAAYTAAMIDEGTSKRDALQIAADLEALGATLGRRSPPRSCSSRRSPRTTSSASGTTAAPSSCSSATRRSRLRSACCSRRCMARTTPMGTCRWATTRRCRRSPATTSCRSGAARTRRRTPR
jgi:zinc protease